MRGRFALLVMVACLFVLMRWLTPGAPRPTERKDDRELAEIADIRLLGWDHVIPVPEYSRVSLLLDRPQYYLGENVLIHFCVTNRGQKPFRVGVGGDYRFAARELRFSVKATDAEGNEVRDPHPSGYCMGGRMCCPTIAPGKSLTFSLPLMRYCRFEKPGVYRLRVEHDLGWKATADRKIPVAEAMLTFLMPSEEQARKVVAEMDRLPEDKSGSMGQRKAPYADFSTLAYPVYVSMLAARAAEGDKRSLRGLGETPTPEATEVLIRVLNHKDAKLASKALLTLNLRMPDPQLEDKLSKRNPFDDDVVDERRWLVGKSWRPEFAPAVRTIGRRLLSEADTESVRRGAFILECLGEKEDMVSLIRALDRAAAQARDMPLEKNTYPRPRGACQELVRAALALSLRGIDPPTAPRSPGELVLFAVAIGARKTFRPQGWEKTYRRVLQHELPYVREIGLENLPVPPTRSLLNLVPALVLDKNIDVQIAACRVAEKVKTPEFSEPILRAVASAREDWQLREAVNAAYKQCNPLDLIRELVSRLDEEGMTEACLEYLAPMILSDDSGHDREQIWDGAARLACKASWLRFLHQHSPELKAGRRYIVADSTVPVRELFSGYRFLTRGK